MSAFHPKQTSATSSLAGHHRDEELTSVGKWLKPNLVQTSGGSPCEL
jgi:hypothetical protein